MKSKKLLSLLLALAMVMSMAACGAKTNEPPATSGTPSETGAPATEELNWPTKEITLIQPWSLGGGPDVITRQIASYSDKILGVPMIVENHTGGSGTIGMNDFLEAEDDGYTLFCCNGPLFSLTPSFIDVDFGEGKKSIFAWEGTEILIQRDKEIQMAVHEYGKGRGVYISGLPYSFVNNRVLYRAILWAAHDEADLHKWFSTNYNVEVHAYVKNGKYCVVNNTYEPQDTTVYTGDGSCFDLHLDTNEIKWYSIEG